MKGKLRYRMSSVRRKVKEGDENSDLAIAKRIKHNPKSKKDDNNNNVDDSDEGDEDEEN